MWSRWTSRVAASLKQRVHRSATTTRVVGVAACTTIAAEHLTRTTEDSEDSGLFVHAASTVFGPLKYFTKLSPSISAATSCEGAGFFGRLKGLARQNTVKVLHDTAERAKLESKYKVDWDHPIGEGTFGSVYTGIDRKTGDRVAVKKINKDATDSVAFQAEMDALLHIRSHGGHPNICGLRANYEEGDYYYLVLDLISGGEMFDQLCNHGAYSEADAARLIREVAGALAFIHGISLVHGDMKPENLLLSSENPSDAVVKIVDFGSAQVDFEDPDPNGSKRSTTSTPAYSPPEFLVAISERPEEPPTVDPEFDMWALGVILYIMLTGVHPFDLYGDATDEEIAQQIRAGHRPPLKRSPITAHLSGHAVKLIEQLLEWDPEKRMTAHDLLENKWVRGETARTKKMAGSDKRLEAYRSFKTKFEAKVFADMVSWTDDAGEDVSKRTSLIERAFRGLDPDDRGYVTTKELKTLAGEQGDEGDKDDEISLSGFSDLLAENMKNVYFPKGTVVYHQGDTGNAMYFINSGTIEVFTRDGSRETRHTGDCFGEGGLLHPKKIRSASVRCVTPVHALDISREYFEKYLASDKNVKLSLREKDKNRKRQRAKTILQLQKNMKPKKVRKGAHVFSRGEEGKELFVVEDGRIELTINGNKVSSVNPGEMTGEHSLIFGKPRNIDAICVTDSCKLQRLTAHDFYILLDSHDSLKEGIRDICYRREFKKALCCKLDRPFPKDEAELRQAFAALDTDFTGVLTFEQVRDMVKNFDSTYTDEECRSIMNSMAVADPGKITWAEFKYIFGTDKDKANKKQ